MDTKKVKLSEVIFDPALYPRKEHDPARVQKYAACLESIEQRGRFMAVIQDMRIVDGRHRQLAYLSKCKPDYEISVFVHTVENEDEAKDLAAELNSEDNYGLTDADKSRNARRMYTRANRMPQEQIARKLGVSKSKVNEWLKSIIEQEKKDREELIWSMWLACYDPLDISPIVDRDRSVINKFVQKMCKEYQENHLHIFSNFTPQIYKLWNFSTLTNKAKVFGSIPQEIIDNLLYYYTKPFDVIFDPFGGGGSTIDVCKKRKRRHYVSDLSPIVERTDLRQWDITQGLPDDLPVPDFVFLDPPYWKQAKKKYSEKDTDLGNIELDSFLDTIATIAKDIKRKWGKSRPDARLAIIIGENKEAGECIDLPFLCYQRIVKYLRLDARIQVPYSTQVHGGNFVKMAKAKKEMLYRNRDLMVFKI